MKTDTIFYRLFQSFPSIFFELIGHPVDEADNYRFDSVEIKQLSFRIDGVRRYAEGKSECVILRCPSRAFPRRMRFAGVARQNVRHTQDRQKAKGKK